MMDRTLEQAKKTSYKVPADCQCCVRWYDLFFRDHFCRNHVVHKLSAHGQPDIPRTIPWFYLCATALASLFQSTLLAIPTTPSRHSPHTQCIIASLSIVNRVARRKLRVQTEVGPMTFDAGGEAAIQLKPVKEYSSRMPEFMCA
jgi:hypothetical protein